jgi:hypothetical protein
MPKCRTDKRTTVKTWDISQSNHYKPNSPKKLDDCGGSIFGAWIREWESASGSMYRSRVYSGAG